MNISDFLPGSSYDNDFNNVTVTDKYDTDSIGVALESGDLLLIEFTPSLSLRVALKMRGRHYKIEQSTVPICQGRRLPLLIDGNFVLSEDDALDYLFKDDLENHLVTPATSRWLKRFFRHNMTETRSWVDHFYPIPQDTDVRSENQKHRDLKQLKTELDRRLATSSYVFRTPCQVDAMLFQLLQNQEEDDSPATYPNLSLFQTRIQHNFLD